jgi:hypothetical protein
VILKNNFFVICHQMMNCCNQAHHVMTILSFIAFVIFLHRYDLHIMNICIMFTPLTVHKRANHLETKCLIRSIKRIYSLLCITNENQLLRSM